VSEGEGGNGSPPHGLDRVDGDECRVCGSGPLRKGKRFHIFDLGFSKRTKKELTQEKWLGIAEKFENLPGGRLHHLEQLSY
jgi:hypothetical protein